MSLVPPPPPPQEGIGYTTDTVLSDVSMRSHTLCILWESSAPHVANTPSSVLPVDMY